jgi:hypothetical protein
MEQSSSWEVNQFADSQEIPRIVWDPKFITAFTSACHLSLSWARLIQSIPPHPTSWRSILILSSPGSPKWSLTLRFPHQNPVYASPLPHPRYMPCLSRSSRLDHPSNIWWAVQIIKLLIM